MLFTEGVVFVVDAYVNVVRQEHWAMRKIDEGGCDEMCGAMADRFVLRQNRERTVRTNFNLICNYLHKCIR